jgi:hypothetical protein
MFSFIMQCIFRSSKFYQLYCGHASHQNIKTSAKTWTHILNTCAPGMSTYCGWKLASFHIHQVVMMYIKCTEWVYRMLQEMAGHSETTAYLVCDVPEDNSCHSLKTSSIFTYVWLKAT